MAGLKRAAAVFAFFSIALCASDQTRLTKRAEYWATRLGLAGWRISVEVVSIEQLLPNTLGHCDYDQDDVARRIEIKVLNREGYMRAANVDWWRVDQERTVVHELVHVAMRKLRRPGRIAFDSPEYQLEEQTVVSIVDALYGRGK